MIIDDDMQLRVCEDCVYDNEIRALELNELKKLGKLGKLLAIDFGKIYKSFPKL